MLRFVVRHHRRGKPALGRLDTHAAEGFLVDPERAAIHRFALMDRLELHHEAIEPVDHLAPSETIAIPLVKPKLERQ
jgi:hypothetical protein